MNLNQLPYIIAIAEQQSLSGAARQVGVSQPALSKYLSELEKSLHIELFSRDKKKLKLTEAGRVYVSAARKILNIQQDTINAIRQNGCVPQKRLCIAVTPHQGAQVIARLWPKFRRRFPTVELDIREGYTKSLYEMVSSGQADYAITTAHKNMPGLNFLPITKEELLLHVPIFYQKIGRSSEKSCDFPTVDLCEFKDAPFVLMDQDTTTGSLTQILFQKINMTPTIVYSSSNVFLLHEMVNAGMGIGFIPAGSAQPSDKAAYFHLTAPCFLCMGIMTRKNYVFSLEDRYLIYLLMKSQETNLAVQYCWSDTLRMLVDEFDNPMAF